MHVPRVVRDSPLLVLSQTQRHVCHTQAKNILEADVVFILCIDTYNKIEKNVMDIYNKLNNNKNKVENCLCHHYKLSALLPFL